MPRRMNRSDRTSITSIALSLRATRIARHSWVNSQWQRPEIIRAKAAILVAKPSSAGGTGGCPLDGHTGFRCRSARATNSIFHLKDRELVPAAGLVDDRGLDAGDPGPARELVEGEVLQMLRIPHDHVHHDVVTAGHEKSDADLRHPGNIIHELIDRAALVLGQFDHEQRLEPHAERLRIDLGM